MRQLRTLLTISAEDELDEASERKISEGLDAYTDEVAPPRNWAPLWIVGDDDLGEAQAGLRGYGD
jgi:hypothetical protein